MNKFVFKKEELLQSIIELIDSSRHNVAITVNSELTVLYWHIGKQINEELLKNEKAEYGKTIIKELSKDLIHLYGRGFSEANLYHFTKFNELFPSKQILYSLGRKLTWTHIRNLIYVEDKLKREFYIQLCVHEQRKDENQPIGLILCSEKSPGQINYLMLNNNEQIKVAEYMTILPDKRIIEQKLQKAIELAKIELDMN